jgi:hypothetical protein
LFVLKQIVADIYAAYEALPGGRDPLSLDEKGEPQFGNLEKARHAAVGKTVWMLQQGTFGSPKLAGTEENPSSYEALCRFLVWMWAPSLEEGWTKMVDLIAACRATVYAPNLGLQNFTIPTELEGRVLHAGTELFILDLTLSVPIPADGSVPTTLVELQSHESLVTEDNGEDDEDGDFTAFESVLVTGPPT